MLLETNNLLIRDFKENDINDAYKYLQDEDVMKYVEPTFTFEQTKEFVLEYGCKRSMVFALEEKCSASVIGHAIFHPYDAVDEYEIGWIINKHCWNKGYAGEVSEALIHHASHDKNASRIVAETVIHNQRALAVIKRLGMVENEERSGTVIKLFELNQSRINYK